MINVPADVSERKELSDSHVDDTKSIKTEVFHRDEPTFGSRHQFQSRS